MKKINVKINENNWKLLKEFEGGTMDKKLNVLMDIVEPFMPIIQINNNSKNIKCWEDTYERLDSYQLTRGESRDNIITRMLITFAELNNTTAIEWIPFKITNKYNDSLVIDGQIEYNSRELSFNYRGNVFKGKLPPTYVVDGKDLTKELYLWYDDLDWEEIIKLLIRNVDNQTVVEQDSFILEINDGLMM